MSKLNKAQASDALIKMANEIASNIAPGQSQEHAANLMADHIVRFWAISMKLQIIKCLEEENKQLDPTATQAITLLKEMYS
ncbi:MAG: formate dehydrogenase subunit delta [Gammaproteobacteria bacterium]|nr:formate dehydrogenase subunit delta [Gammaproteobacteria bacterium]